MILWSDFQLKYIIPFIFIFFSFGAEMAFSDDVSPVTVLKEDFEDVFPPEGWTVESINEYYSWRQVNSAADGNLTDVFDGQYFAYVGGSSDQIYEESIITSKIEISYDGVSNFNFYFAIDPFYSFSDDFDLSVEKTTHINSPSDNSWSLIGSIKNKQDDIKYHLQSSDWYYGFSMVFKNSSSFLLRFKYNSFSGIGLALDHIQVEHKGYSPGGYDDDDENVNPKKDSDDKEEDCNCGLSFHDPAAPLALLMVLVGCGALLISRRKN